MTSTIHSPDTVHLRITMPDFPDVQMVMAFSPDDTVWNVKQRFLQNLKKDLADGQNYGLYVPPASCRTGKFLDEERCLREYPLTGGIKYFEFKYKNRIKYSVDVSTMKLKKINTATNQKEFLELVRRDDMDKTSKMLNKGFNPNYNHDAGGETPLTTATKLRRPRTMIITLVSGGAFIDYRNKQGCTPLHATVLNKNKDAMRTLLDLGSSPNYKDSDNRTPLFLCCTEGSPLQLTSMLLHERAQLQGRDRHGYTELHHACKRAKTELVEQLVFYGADLNSQDHNGDTPLHVCASYNHDGCCKVLMIRGADKNVTNNKGQTPSKLAQTNSNANLYRLIEDFKTSDIIYFNDLPVYNEKRRGLLSAATIRSLEKSRSNPNLHLLFANQLNPTSTISAASLNTLANHANNHVSNLTNNHTTKPSNNTMNITNNYTNNYSNNRPNIRTRSDGQRLSAMEMEWIADKKEETPRYDMKESLNNPFEELNFKLKKTIGRGYGFAIKNVDEVNDRNPCSQVFNEVYDGKGAAIAGLQAGDYLYELNGQNVSDVTHDTCVRMVKSAGDELRVKVLRRMRSMKMKGATVSSSVLDTPDTFPIPSANEKDDVFTNHVHSRNTDTFGDRVDSRIPDKTSDISKPLDNLKSESERILLAGDHQDEDRSTTANISHSISVPQISASELQATVPAPPPIPQFGTLKLNKSKETPSIADSLSNSPNRQRAKDVVNSPLPIAAHNDLLDAIKRRKQLVDDVGSDVLSASIESRVNQSKKLHSLNKISVIEDNKDKIKNNAFTPQSPLNRQNYGLLAYNEPSKTLGKQPKSPILKPNDTIIFSKPIEPLGNNIKANEYSPTIQAKTLPRKSVNEDLKEADGKEGFLADAEKLRQLFLNKRFNSNIALEPSNVNEDTNSKGNFENNEKESMSNSLKENQSAAINKLDLEPSSNFHEPENQNSQFDSLKQPQIKSVNSENHNDINKQQNSKLVEEIRKVNGSEDKKSKIDNPKLSLNTSLTNGVNGVSPSPSPSIGLLANIVAEKAQQKQDSNRTIQEPSFGSSRIYSAGDTLTKNKSPPITGSPNIVSKKPLNTLYTSQNSSSPTIGNHVTSANISSNKKIYTSAPKTSTNPPTEEPGASPDVFSAQKPRIENSKFMFQSSNHQPVKPNYNILTKPPVSKPHYQSQGFSNNFSNNSKVFSGNGVKFPPATSPKSFLQNNKLNNSKVYNSQFNENNKITENNNVSSIASNFNGNIKPSKNGTLTFYKSNSDPSDSAKRPTDFRGALNPPQVTPSNVFEPSSPKVSTPPEPAFPTLRKTPQQTNTHVFKAKPHSTPNSPPTRKY